MAASLVVPAGATTRVLGVVARDSFGAEFAATASLTVVDAPISPAEVCRVFFFSFFFFSFFFSVVQGLQ